jgi:uncharacterized protein YjbJ (UPF0337 family)
LRRESFIMGLPNRDEVKGKVEQAKGGLKEKVGHALKDRKMENRGSAERSRGQVREGFGKARRKVGEKIENLGKAVKK